MGNFFARPELPQHLSSKQAGTVGANQNEKKCTIADLGKIA